MLFWLSIALVHAQSWVPQGTFAEPWSTESIGSSELFVISAGGTQWLVVRRQGRTLERAAAYAAIAAEPGVSVELLTQLACATVAPGRLGAVPWTRPSPSIDDALEQAASAPRLVGRDLRYWLAAEGDLIEVVVGPDGAVKERNSAAGAIRTRREAVERYETSWQAARTATSAERAVAAIRTMVSTNDPRVGAGLADLASSHAPAAARVLALELLVERRGAQAVDVLGPAARDASPEVRAAAVRLLGTLGTAGRGALELVSDDPDPEVRDLALEALLQNR